MFCMKKVIIYSIYMIFFANIYAMGLYLSQNYCDKKYINFPCSSRLTCKYFSEIYVDEL